MWCSHCQQDVPGIVSQDDDGGICCARCNQTLSGGRAGNTDIDVQASEADLSADPPSLALDDWELQQELRAAEQLVTRLKGGVSRGDTKQRAIHAQHSHVPAAHFYEQPKRVPSRARARRSPRSSFLSWTIISLGVMVFVFGGVLLGWSFVEERGDLWNLGMPLTLVGQAILLVGLILQLEVIWQTSRDTTETLGELDSELGELRRATTLLSTTHSSASQSFYSHMVEGASPQLLLADVKSQLDLLALKMAGDD